MSLLVGQELGTYRITSLLGKGGMGEVYRVHDPALKRDVAIKILPEEFARDADRLSRFQREAEALAALNHKNIAAIYTMQHSGDTRFLVMELVEGDTLADVVHLRGALPLDEAVDIATQICEALEAAHERGIVHRDLKPSNVKIAPDGMVKVLDFGLAKALEPATSWSGSLANSPTISLAATNAGVILGTAAYMSPEQAKGRPVDRRSDIFAFGCVLYEMLTGHPAFDGADVADILAAVLQRDPDWTRLPTHTPPAIEKLLRRALEKDVRQRLGDIRDARFELEEAHAPAPVVSALSRTTRLAWIASLAISAAIIATLAVPALRHFQEVAPPERRLEISTPFSAYPLDFALSPDGRQIVFVASGGGPQRLWLRALDKTTAQPIAGTDNARQPFWSPDSKSIGFFASNKLYRIDVTGGAAQALADAATPRGGTWNPDDTILFTPNSFSPIMRVAATGGATAPLTQLTPGQFSHWFPRFLPDGRHFVFYAPEGGSGVLFLASLDGGEPTRVAEAEGSASPVVGNRIAFVRKGTLVAQTLDEAHGQLTGVPIVLADQVGFEENFDIHAFSASAEGSVAYRTGTAGRVQLTWFDRSGKVLGAAGDADENSIQFLQLSPDGQRVVLNRTMQGNQDVWVMDLTRGGLTRQTFDGLADVGPIWSPDGTRMAFSSNRKGRFNLYVASSNAPGGEQLLYESPNLKVVQDWSRDDRYLLFYETDPKTQRDLWSLDLTDKTATPRVVVNTPAEESLAEFSPDGHWVAYQTNESNRFEIVVQPFPDSRGAKWQVSAGGGVAPRWRADGKELYYVAPDSTLVAVPILTATGSTFQTGTPLSLFSTGILGGGSVVMNRSNYATSSDGRFLVAQPLADASMPPIVVILNPSFEKTK
jgi:serine/threonine protein kinase